MKIKFAEIPAEGMLLKINDPVWFPERELERCGPAAATVFLEWKSPERVMLDGRVEVCVRLFCDRCLEDYCLDLTDSFRVDLEYLPPGSGQSAEHHCSSMEMDTLFLSEPAIDIYQLLAQQVFLLLPEKKICRQDCRGLCPHCGVNLNQETCDCSAERISSPFSVLANYKKR